MRDVPYVEDLGRRARRWTIAGYLIGPTYIADRAALIAACETNGPGTLVHPTLGTVQANCESYSTSESRERGGLATFEMVFVESGNLQGTAITTDTQSAASSAGSNLGNQSGQSLDNTTNNSLANGGTISI